MPATYASVDDVIELAPELASVPAAQLALIVDTITKSMITAAAWGDQLLEGHRTLAAHWATVELNEGSAGGVVTSRRIDQLQESYATGSFSDSELSTTKYGRMHLALRALHVSKSRRFVGEARGWELPDGRVL